MPDSLTLKVDHKTLTAAAWDRMLKKDHFMIEFKGDPLSNKDVEKQTKHCVTEITVWVSCSVKAYSTSLTSRWAVFELHDISLRDVRNLNLLSNTKNLKAQYRW